MDHPLPPNVVPPGREPSHEARREARVPHRAVVIMPYTAGADAGFEQVELVDCSPRGIAILRGEPLSAGDEFFLKIRINSVRLVVYSVRHCTPAQGGYRIGAALWGFISTPNDPDPDPAALLRALLAL